MFEGMKCYTEILYCYKRVRILYQLLYEFKRKCRHLVASRLGFKTSDLVE